MMMDMKTAKQILNENGFLLEDTNTKSLVGKFWAAKKNGETLSKEDAEALLNAPDFDEVVNPKYKNYILAVCRKTLGVAKPENPNEEKPAVEEQPKTKDLRDPKTGLPPVEKENFFKLWPEGYVCPWYGNFRKNSKNYTKFKEVQNEIDNSVKAYNKMQKDKVQVDSDKLIKEIVDGLDLGIEFTKCEFKDGGVRLEWKPTKEDLSNEEYNKRWGIEPEHENIYCSTEFALVLAPINKDWVQDAISEWEPEHRKEYAGSHSNQFHWNYPVDHYEVSLSISDQEGPTAKNKNSSFINRVKIDQDNIVGDSIEIVKGIINAGRYKVHDPDHHESMIGKRSGWLDYDDYKLKRWGHWH